jgi:hypothetical protein
MPKIHYLAMALSLLGLVAIIQLIRRGLFRERYALIWLFSGLVSVAVCASPGLLEAVCRTLDVTVPLNLLLFLAVLFLAAVCMMLSIVVSKQAMRIEILAKEIGLLKNDTHNV